MIARVWKGATPEAKADEYFAFLMKSGVRDYESTEGNHGVLVLRQVNGEQAEFTLISLWESLDAIKRFAGSDVEQAFYYPEDKDFLLAFEPKVKHFEVLLNTLKPNS